VIQVWSAHRSKKSKLLSPKRETLAEAKRHLSLKRLLRHLESVELSEDLGEDGVVRRIVCAHCSQETRVNLEVSSEHLVAAMLSTRVGRRVTAHAYLGRFGPHGRKSEVARKQSSTRYNALKDIVSIALMG
jgi:hypothetical protein